MTEKQNKFIVFAAIAAATLVVPGMLGVFTTQQAEALTLGIKANVDAEVTADGLPGAPELPETPELPGAPSLPPALVIVKVG